MPDSSKAKLYNSKYGSHACCLFESEFEHQNSVVQNILNSLTGNAKTIYFFNQQPLSSVVENFVTHQFDYQQYINCNQLYLSDETSASKIIDLINSELQNVSPGDWSRLCVIIEMNWLRNEQSTVKLNDFILKLTKQLQSAQLMLICNYDMREFSTSFLQKILTAHPVIILNDEMLENIYYIQQYETDKHQTDYEKIHYQLQSIQNYNQLKSEEKRLQDRLVERDYLFNASQNVASIGSYKTDFVAGFWESSPVLDKIFGIDKNYIRSVAGWLDIVHPDDCEKMNNYLVDEIIGKHNKFNHEYRIISKDNQQIKYVHGLGEVEFDADGKLISMIGTIQDITERKRVEDKLQQSQVLNRNILDHTQNIIYVNDVDGKYLLVNKQFEKIFDVKQNNILGKTGFDIFPAEYANQFKQIDVRIIATGQSIEIEETAPQKDGLHYYLSSKFPLIDNNGKVTAVCGISIDITERKIVEQELIKAKEKAEESEAKVRYMFENSLTGYFYIDVNGNILDANQAMVNILGSPSIDETKKINVLHYQSLIDLGFASDVAKCLESSIIITNEKLYTSKWNKKSYAKYSLIPIIQKNVIQGIWANLEDLTELWKSQNELMLAKELAEASEKAAVMHYQSVKKRNSEISALLQGARMVLEFKDFEQTVEELFNICKLLTGAIAGFVSLLSDNAVQNRIVLIHGDQGSLKVDRLLTIPLTGIMTEAIKNRLATVFNDFTDTNLSNSIPKDHLTLTNVLFAPLIINHKAAGLIVLANKPDDFTDDDKYIVTAFAELAAIALNNSQTMQELVLAKTKAEESDRLKTAFLQNMSHEVRTPMNAIIGFTQLITKPDVSPDKAKIYSAMINDGCSKLIDIITDMIEISQLQAKLVTIKESTFDIVAVFKEIQDEFKAHAEDKGLYFVFDTKINSPTFTIISDQTKIEKIARHLLDNAIKFTQTGVITIEYNYSSGNLNFTVSDTGIGISEQMQRIIFEPFRQAELGVTRTYGGNGLGLAICKSYIGLLNGFIDLESESGRGSKFTVSIPVIQVTNIDRKIVPIPQYRNLTNKIILIAEDEKSNFEYLAEILADTNATILRAINGAEAVDICRKNAEIDFVLMDIQMPVMDGQTATKFIKAFRPGLPIVAQTAYALENEKIKFTEAGFDAYLTKPILEKNLIETIRKYLI